MPVEYADPYYSLLICFLVKHQISKPEYFNFEILKHLSKGAREEILEILTRNKLLKLLETNNIINPGKKVVDASQYYRLKVKNEKLLHTVTKQFSTKMPKFKSAAPTLFELSARAICMYAKKHGLFGNPVMRIDSKKQSIALQKRKKSNWELGSSYKYQWLPQDIFNPIKAIYETKTMSQKIAEQYESHYSFLITQDFFKYNGAYIRTIINFLLKCVIRYKSENSHNFRLASKIIFLNNVTPLHLACEFNAPIGLVEELLQYYDVNDSANNLQWPPLHRACFFNASTGLIDLLLKKHAKMEHQGEANSTPLLIACYYGYEKLALHLLEKGANANATLHWKASIDWQQHYYFNGASALHLAFLSNSLNAAKYIILTHSDFTQTTRAKVLSLHLACQYANYELVKLLLRQTPRTLDLIDNQELNPADYALFNTYNEKNDKDKIEKKLILSLLKFYEIEPTEKEKKIKALFSVRKDAIDITLSYIESNEFATNHRP